MEELGKEDYLNHLFQQIRQGKVVLFLGAGASVPAGGPTSSQLINQLRQDFKQVDTEKEITDFNELCDAIAYTNIYGKKILYEYLQELFLTLKPSKYHSLLPYYDWLAIFTTNYDTIIEQAFQVENRLKKPRVIRSELDNFNPFNRDVCYIVKLNGCALINYNQKGCMALTRLDIEQAKKSREKQYDILLEAIKDGCLLFIGYSFEDLLALGIINKAIQQLGKENIPSAFALFPHLSSIKEWRKNRLKDMRIIPIEEDFEGFFSKLQEKVKPETIYRKARKKTVLTVRGKKIELNEEDVDIYEESFHILNDFEIFEPTEDIKGFFQCTNKSWGAYYRHWDFERNYYSGENTTYNIINKDTSPIIQLLETSNLKELVMHFIEKIPLDQSKILFVPGIPGIGKTVMARRLAFDLYTSELPVLFCSHPRSLREDLIVNFYKQINQKIVETESKNKFEIITKLVLIVDDAAQSITYLINLKQSLIDQGVPIIIVAFDRLGEWRSRKKHLGYKLNLSQIIELQPIDKSIEEDEKKRIIAHLMNLGIIEHPEKIEWDNESTFFGLLYSLVHPSQVRFHEIIKNQFQYLTPKAQELFKIICFIHQYNCLINLELLCRVLGYTYKEIFELVDGECSGIIHVERDRHENTFYRTHHRIIATKTIEFFFPDPNEQVETLIQIFKKAKKSIPFERELCHTIAINHLSERREELRYTINQLSTIFDALCERNPTSALLHHNAIIKRDMKNYDEATKLLKKALDKADIEKYEGYEEKKNYIFNTWGMVEAEKGFEAQQRKDFRKAEFYFKSASYYFNLAKKINPSDSYPYFTEAFILYRRGISAVDKIEKIEFLSQALEIIDIALNYVDQASYDFYSKMKLKILLEIETLSSTSFLNIAKEMAERDKNLYGYFLIAYKLYQEGIKNENEKAKKEKCKDAIEILDEALQYNSSEPSCLNLKITILENIFPEKLEDIDYHYNLLNRLFMNSDYLNVNRLYDYGVICFKKQYYSKGMGIFHKLKRISRHINRRYMIRDILENIFEGEIIQVDQYKGYVISKNPRIKERIYFNPLYQTHIFRQGDMVKFRIGFNFLGPVAIEIQYI